MLDRLDAEEAAGRHRGEKLAQLGRKCGRVLLGTCGQAREQVGGQDADILGERDREVAGSGSGRRRGPDDHTVGTGDAGEVGRGLLGDLGGGDGRAQRLRVGEGFAQQIEPGRLQQVVEGELGR